MSESSEKPAAEPPAGVQSGDASTVHPTSGEPSVNEPVPAVSAEPAPVTTSQPAPGPATSAGSAPPVPGPAASAWTPPAAPQDVPAAAASTGPFPADRPEVAVGAAFAGGLVLAMILKRLAR